MCGGSMLLVLRTVPIRGTLRIGVQMNSTTIVAVTSDDLLFNPMNITAAFL